MRLRDIEDITLVNTTYENKSVLEEVDLAFVPWENNSMDSAFRNCINLTNVINIHQNVNTMYQTFYECTNLVNAPEIPQNVTNLFRTFMDCHKLINVGMLPNNVDNMVSTFENCYNLVNAPVIPDSVTTMYSTFQNCNNLINPALISNNATDISYIYSGCSNISYAPNIPESVIEMPWAFEGCANIVNAPLIGNNVVNMDGTFVFCNNLTTVNEIPENVVSMSGTFSDCNNLVGDIVIKSNQINNASQCFYNDSNELFKNVFIPFKYNNTYTSTYNAFIEAGYSTEYRVNGALLMDLNGGYWRYDTLQNNTKLLYEWVGKETTIWAIKNNSLFNNYGYDAALDINTSQSNTPFYNNPRVEVAELEFVPWVNDSMAYAFYNAVNVVAIHNIHYNVTNYHKAFWNCRNLTDVTIPASIFDNGDMSDAFVGTNITNVTYVKNDGTPYIPDPTDTSTPPYNASGSYSNTPIITTPNLPGSTDDLSWAFEDCFYLENTSMLPQGAVNMQGTFYNCYNLKEYKNIASNKIEDVSMCFYNCTNLVLPGSINDNATNMYRTYYNCVNMQFIPNIPNCAVNMQETYYNCQTITSVPNVPGNVVNMEGTFDGCVNVVGDINIISEVITNVYNCFNNTTAQKNIYIPYYYENGELSATYNSFLEAGYISETPINGVSVYDMYYDPELEEWRYQPIANREKILLEYLGSSNIISVPTNKTYINCYNSENQSNMPFYNKSLFESVNLRNVRFVNNDMSYAFYGCSNLVNVTNINQNVVDMTRTFFECSKLNAILTIPNNVTNMVATFFGCSNLINAPTIPNSVVNMEGIFASCTNLRNVNKISNNAENLAVAFYGCSNLVNVSVIPENVTNMISTFQGCSNLNGTILIRTNKISDAISCFDETSLYKNVYIPFTYQNGEYTQTYNSFINANYSTSIRKDGVLLYDYTPELYDWLFTSLNNGYTSLYRYIGNNTDVIVPNNNTVFNTDKLYIYGKNVNSVDMNNVPCENNSMSFAFYGCSNLTSVTNINKNVTSIFRCFNGCSNLVNAPVIPNSVTDMTYAFYECTNLVNAPDLSNCTNLTSMTYTFGYCNNLVNAPVIPNSVTNMSWTFLLCSNLVNAPDLTNCNNLTNMYETFSYCTNLVNVIEIPNSVTDMCQTFAYCTNLVNAPDMSNCNNIIDICKAFDGCANLTGDIIIGSNIITNANRCFANTSLDKNVYIPFYYSNGMVSATYNAFISAGYSETERKDGVLLKKLRNYNVDFDGYIITNNGADVELQKYEGSESIIVTPHLYY